MKDYSRASWKQKENLKLFRGGNVEVESVFDFQTDNDRLSKRKGDLSD